MTTTSEQVQDLATALAQAQGEIVGAVKDSQNPFFRSTYADLASVWDACRGPLSKHGLSVVQFPATEFIGEQEPYEWQSKAGETRMGVRVVCKVSVTTRLLHLSGQWIEGVVSTLLPTGDPQSVGSAITYLRRYALQSVVGVAAEDDDAEATRAKQLTPRQVARPDPPKQVLDTDTGELVSATERPAAPKGYAYLYSVTLEDGWYHLFFPDASGGNRLEYKTKLQRIGDVAMQAFQDGVPVKLDVKKAPWVDGVHPWKPETPAATEEPVTASDIPF